MFPGNFQPVHWKLSSLLQPFLPRDQAHPCKFFSTASLLSAFSCREGEFLDMQSQQCQKCAAGTYSLGTGIAFDEWDTLPSGFVTHGVNTNGEDVVTDCSKSVHTAHILPFMHQSGR